MSSSTIPILCVIADEVNALNERNVTLGARPAKLRQHQARLHNLASTPKSFPSAGGNFPRCIVVDCSEDGGLFTQIPQQRWHVGQDASIPNDETRAGEASMG